MVRYLDGTMHLVNYHLGGSLYTMAAITVAGGLPQTTLLMAVSAVLTCVVYMNLADVATHQGAGSLCRIVSSVLGRKPALVLRVLIMLNALGVIVAYTQACLDIYSSTQSAATTGGFVTFVVMLVIGCTTVPVLECLRPGTADWGSLVANTALLVLLGSLFWVSPADLSAAPLPESKSFWETVISFGPSLVFAFSSAQYVLFACGVCDANGALLSEVNVRRNVGVIGVGSLVVSFSIYMLVGYGGLRAFGPAVKDDILKNFSLEATNHEILFAAVLGTNAVSLLLSFPVFAEELLLYARELLQDLLSVQSFEVFKKHQLSRFCSPTHPYLGSAWIIPLALLITKSAPGLLSIITLMSSCTDYSFMFVFPSLAFCVSFGISQRPLRWALNSTLLVGALYMACHSFAEELSKLNIDINE